MTRFLGLIAVTAVFLSGAMRAEAAPPAAPGWIDYPSESFTGVVDVFWDTVGDATFYDLERTEDGGVSWDEIYSGPNNDFSDDTVTDGEYVYRVRAGNVDGVSDWTAGGTVTVSPPDAPASINYPVESKTGIIDVSWAAADGAQTYRLERSADNGESWVQLYDGAALQYEDSVVAGEYIYRVQSRSVEASSAWTTGHNLVVSLPDVPDWIDYPEESITNEINVTWAQADGALTYDLERSDDDGASWTEVYSGVSDQFTDNVISGTYLYRVRSTSEAGSSDWITGGPLEVAIVPGMPPSIDYPVESLTGRFTVSWGEAADAHVYRLVRLTDGETWTEVYLGADIEVLVVEDEGVYVYRVRAENNAGESGWVEGHEVIVVLSAQENWRRDNFPEEDWDNEDVAGPMADPNEDGVVNIVNFALRGDPNENDTEIIAPRMELDELTGNLVYTFRVRSADGVFDADGSYQVDGVAYHVQTVTEAGADNWAPLDMTDENTEFGQDADGTILRVLISEEMLEGTKGFARLIVQDMTAD